MLEWYLYSCNEGSARSAMACVYFSTTNAFYSTAAINIAITVLKAVEQLQC